MKKALVLVLSLALALCLAIPALAADDVVIYDFADGSQTDGKIGWNEGLTTQYGIPEPTVNVQNGQLTITPQAGNFWAGSIYFDLAKGCEWLGDLSEGLESGEYNYIRLYIKNNMPCDDQTDTFGFSFSLQKMNDTNEYNTNWGAADFSKALFFNMDGSKADIEISPDINNGSSDRNGYKNGYITLPKGFEGYIFISAKLADFPTHTTWGLTPLDNFSNLGRLELDLRNAGTSCDGSTNNLILDDIALVKTAEVPKAPVNPDDDKTDKPGEDGDISIVLYAAAAISGLGALAIRKRK